MSESNQSPGIKLTPLLLLAIPLAMYSHSKGIGIEDIRNYLFWIWIVCFVATFAIMTIGESNTKNPMHFKKSVMAFGMFGTVNFILWLFAKLMG